MDKFDALQGDEIHRILGIRSTSIGCQYSEIIRSLLSFYFSSSDCIKDISLILRDNLSDHPGTRIPSSDTVLRAIEELATENVTCITPSPIKDLR